MGGCGCTGGCSGRCACASAAGAVRLEGAEILLAASGIRSPMGTSDAADSRWSAAADPGFDPRILPRRIQKPGWRGPMRKEMLRRAKLPKISAPRLPSGTPAEVYLYADEPREAPTCGSRDSAPADQILRPDGNLRGEPGPMPLGDGWELLLPAMNVHVPSSGDLSRQSWKTLLRTNAGGDVILRAPRGVQEATVHGAAGPPIPQDLHGGGVEIQPVALGPAVLQYTFGYRTVSFDVSASFLLDYWADWHHLHRLYTSEDTNDYEDTSYGMVSSVTDIIAEYWGGLSTAVTGDFGAFHKLIGCYNLPRSGEWVGDTYSFWAFGWGAPHKVHLWTCQMLYGLGVFIDYSTANVEAGATECIGFRGAVPATVARGASSTCPVWTPGGPPT